MPRATASRVLSAAAVPSVAAAEKSGSMEVGVCTAAPEMKVWFGGSKQIMRGRAGLSHDDALPRRRWPVGPSPTDSGNPAVRRGPAPLFCCAVAFHHRDPPVALDESG